MWKLFLKTTTCLTRSAVTPSRIRLAVIQTRLLAGVEGVEPSLTEPESAVLPLDDTPVRKLALRALNGRKS